MAAKKKSRGNNNSNTWWSFQTISTVTTLIFSATMLIFTYRQTQINEQLKNISKTQLDFVLTERNAPPKVIIKNRFTNLFNYFDIDPLSFDLQEIAEGKQSCKISPNPHTKKYLERLKKLKQQFDEKILETSLFTDEVPDEDVNKFKQNKKELLEEFVSKIKTKKEFHIRRNDGFITLAMSVNILNQRDFPLTITSIDYYLAGPKSKESLMVYSPPISLEPDIFEMNSDRKIKALSLPYVIPAKRGVTLVVAFHTFCNVLEINWGSRMEAKLNAILFAFYHLGIEINEYRAGNDASDILPESFLTSKYFPFYQNKITVIP